MTVPNNLLYGLILAGGKSKRMGQDKALLSYHGTRQLDFVYHLLKGFCQQVFVSTREDQKNQEGYKHLPQVLDLPEFSNIGPLGGILSAMKSYPNASWFVLACDLPYIDSTAISNLIKNRDSKTIATSYISSHDSLPEPLCAIWEGQGIDILLEFLKKGLQCPRKILINSKPKLIQQNNPKWLENVNNPDELQNFRNN